MSHMVYPGAQHTRFHHAMGAMHLMTQAIEVLREKGNKITDEEAKGVTLAILLHDIGHGPFSHALEHSIVDSIHHEDISLMFMERLNEELKGELDVAIKIFTNQYPKKFLHQLVSSQLDMDRLDYLMRDSFYSGVHEGIVGSERIIAMLDIHKDELVIEEKGIYSVEKFIVARRLMYWQVYLHKTVLAAETMIVNILKRAKELAMKNEKLFCTPALEVFLYNNFSEKDFRKNRKLLEQFSQLDDFDIMASIKVWASHKDKVLSKLCRDFVNRKLFRVKLEKTAISRDLAEKEKIAIQKKWKLTGHEADYFIVNTTTANYAYNTEKDKINILYRNGQVIDIAEASDNFNIRSLSNPVKKFVLCVSR